MDKLLLETSVTEKPNNDTDIKDAEELKTTRDVVDQQWNHRKLLFNATFWLCVVLYGLFLCVAVRWYFCNFAGLTHEFVLLMGILLITPSALIGFAIKSIFVSSKNDIENLVENLKDIS